MKRVYKRIHKMKHPGVSDKTRRLHPAPDMTEMSGAARARAQARHSAETEALKLGRLFAEA